jgi:nucleotide-binding universal stress UspA family protein
MSGIAETALQGKREQNDRRILDSLAQSGPAGCEFIEAEAKGVKPMQRFKNILIALDSKTRNKALLERGAALAQRNQACLTVIDVVEDAPGSAPWPILSRSSADLSKYIIERHSHDLEQLSAPLRQKGFQVNTKVLTGTPFLEIIREVLRNRHDLVIIMAEDQGGLKERLFGSTTMHLLRKCPCPVWVMKRTQPRHYQRILAAVDPDPVDEQRNALNKTIMGLATSLAHREQSELHIIHTWTLYGESMLRGPRINMPRTEMAQLLRKTKDEYRRRLNELLRPYALDKLTHQVHLLKGNPGSVIPKVAQAKRIELIVMGTVCRTGVAGLIVGNTAENVLRQVDCSVLTVKPEGFITPIRLDDKVA